MGPQHRGRAHRQGEGQGVAEAIGKEQLGHREHDVVLAVADDALTVQPGGLHGTAVHVQHALAHSRRARRVEPEGGFVGAGPRRRVVRRVRRELGAEVMVAIGRAADDEDMLEGGQLGEYRLERPEQRRRDEQRARAAIPEDVLVLIRRQQRVQHHRHDAGTDAAQEDDREVDGIEHRMATRDSASRRCARSSLPMRAHPSHRAP